MIEMTRLHSELIAAGLELADSGCCKMDANQANWPKETTRFYKREKDDRLVKVGFVSPPTPEQEAMAAAVIKAHDGTPTPEEKLVVIGMDKRLAALCVLAQGGPDHVLEWAKKTIEAAAKEVIAVHL